MEKLLAARADVNGKGAKFTNASTAASSQGHDKILFRLLEKGAAESTDVEPHNTAVCSAIRAGHTSTARLLLMHGHMVSKNQLKHCLIEAIDIGADEIALLLL